MTKNRKQSIDPVVIVTIGVVFLAIAMALIAFSSGSSIAGDASTTSQLMVAFITGLTTGGLSCLAVQGGLLASSLAHQIEQDYVGQVASGRNMKKTTVSHTSSAFPILLFLISKIVAYTLLGALLG